MNPYNPLTATPSPTKHNTIAIAMQEGSSSPLEDFAPVGYVERYCCCVVVSPAERIISFKIAPPQTINGLSPK